MSRTDEPRFSLIVATFGRAHVLRVLVDSLLQQTDTDFEVIVADQNQDDSVAPMIEPLRAAGLLGRHLRLGQANLSAARNAGLAVARGEFVAFPDDDCWYEPGTLAAAARAFVADPDLDGIAAHWPEAPAEKGDARAVIGLDAMRRFRAGNVASITLFLKSDPVREAGGFDESIGVGRWYGAGEETDLVLTLLARGASLKRVPDVVVHHRFDARRGRMPLGRLCRQERARARGTGCLYAKHRLPASIIARGLIAPLLALPVSNLVLGATRSLGRLEGFLRWHLVPPARQQFDPARSSREKGKT